jgi:cell division protein FtsL
MTNRRARNGKKRGAVLKLSLILYICFCLFAIVSLRTAIFNMEYELGELDKFRAGLMSERKMMIAQRANFFSTERVENVAIKRLGMRLPERENVYFVKRTVLAGPYRASMNRD